MRTWIVERNYIYGLEIWFTNMDWIQGVTNLSIYLNTLIFLDIYIHPQKYLLDIRATDVFKQSLNELFQNCLDKYVHSYEYLLYFDAMIIYSYVYLKRKRIRKIFTH